MNIYIHTYIHTSDVHRYIYKKGTRGLSFLHAHADRDRQRVAHSDCQGGDLVSLHTSET